MNQSIGRNEPCHCGSGKKYKKCHLEKDEAVDRKAREKAALNAAKVAKKNEEAEKEGKPGVPSPKAQHHQENKSWLGQMANKVGFLKSFSQRRTPSKGG